MNEELARIFANMADYLEMKDDVFRPIAYRRVSFVIKDYPREMQEIFMDGGKDALKNIPGIGEHIADKIVEYIETGKIAAYEKLKEKAPVNLEELNEIEGLGPKKIKVLYGKLGVASLKDLKRAATNHQIAELEGFGEKSEQNILENILLRQEEDRRWPREEVRPIAEEVVAKLRRIREVKRVEIGGSLRRHRDTIGDVDILVLSDSPEKVMDAFVSLPVVEKVWNKGLTKTSVRSKQGFDIDVRVVKEEAFAAAWLYFTGPKEHNIAMRRVAIKKGFKLNEYGLFKGKEPMPAKKEKDIYQALDLTYVAPDKRRDQL